MATPMTTYAPTGSDGGADDAAAGAHTALLNEPTSHPGLPALPDHCAELGMRKVEGELPFAKSRQWALERASDLLSRADAAHDRMGSEPNPQDLTFAYAWLAYAREARS